MSKITNRLIDNLLQGKTEQSSGDKLKINNVIGAAAIVYEKVRNAVDYQEEHLIRKNAIYRILRRKLLYEKVVFENYLLDKYHSDNMSKQLILELVRGGYIPKTVPEKMVDVVDEIVQKYEKLFSNIKETKGKVDKKTYRYFLELAAVELESALIPPKKEKAMANAMFSVYNPRLEFAAEDINKKQKELQVYIACYRALWKYDESMLRFLLLSLYYPEWKENDQELIIKLSNNVDKLIREFDKQINHPWQKLLQKILKKRAIVFWIIQDIVEANPDQAEEIFSDKERLENEIKKALTKRYKNVRVKLRRGVVRSIIYVFFTKMILALAVEVPLDIYLAGYINKVSMAINILFPPLLMFLVAIMIRMPKKENAAKITQEIMDISFKSNVGKKYILKDTRKRGKIVKGIFNLVYAASFIFSLMVIFWGLNKLDFNVGSSFIFVLFLTLVSFFGIRIRRPVKELMMVERRQSLLSALVDFFALPFVSMGRWMSVKFSKMNFIAYFLDIIIEAPFKLLIEVFEDLFGFIREKKEEVMED